MQKDQWSVEKAKQTYFEKLKGNPLPMEFTQLEIDRINQHLENNKRVSKLMRYYTFGYLSVVQNQYVHLEDSKLSLQILSYAAGIRDAHYKGFLLQQLELLKQGKQPLPDKSTPKGFAEIKQANHENKIELLDRLSIVKYFEGDNVKVQLFTADNEQFRALAKLDYAEIYEAENDKTNLKIKEAWRTRDFIHTKCIREAEDTEMEALFVEKFKLGKVLDGFKTEAKFAKREIELNEWQHKKYFGWLPILEQWFDLLKRKAGQQDTQQRTAPPPAIITDLKPIFKPEALQTIFDHLKDFFSSEQQTQFKLILQTGNNTGGPLIFNDNGNRLADAFKQLKEKDFITGCDKLQLQKWIAQNFRYTSLKRVKTFTPDYIEKCISRNYYPCKNPLFKIVNGQIQANT